MDLASSPVTLEHARSLGSKDCNSAVDRSAPSAMESWGLPSSDRGWSNRRWTDSSVRTGTSGRGWIDRGATADVGLVGTSPRWSVQEGKSSRGKTFSISRVESHESSAVGRLKSIFSQTFSKSMKPSASREFGYIDFSSKVTSLDQLCAQATGLDPILRSKVKEWALGSKGQFPCFDQDGKRDFILWQDALDHPDKIKKIRFAKLKTVNRAVEKLMRSYREDVSRLLDVCRQSIVFDNVKDLTACLIQIYEDPEATIVRIKNRLDPSYNSYASAGYRDVALNLRICNRRSSHMALDTHVCEVQLLLKQVAEIKNEDGHKRYIQFRNARGQ
uniref:RelA/SpoT domain-containing protein n=1 Tax=Hemiselmis tepida TaxID=464990 RepID=A0A7S0W940_9CRYP